MQKEKASLDDLRVFVAQNNCPGKSTFALNQTNVRGRTNFLNKASLLQFPCYRRSYKMMQFDRILHTVDSGAFDAHSSSDNFIELSDNRLIMSKIILLVLFAMVAMTVTLAAPMEEYVNAELSEGVGAFSEQDLADLAEDHLRFRRVTCDLLSFGNYASHSACAANCLTMGKAGGRCNDGVCQCRKTKIKDLWDKRFG